MNNDYYVYFHKHPITGEVFYVGKGRARRCNSKNRSKAWKDYVEKAGGFECEKYAENLTSQDALKLETELINKHDNLVNKFDKREIITNLLQYSERLEYDPTSPTFLRWKKVSPKSGAKVGDVAGSIRKNGYACVSINYKPIAVHRFVWALFNNCEIPEGMVINHIDCNPANNAIENLECISVKENNQKKSHHSIGKLMSTNNTGVTGVIKSKTSPNKSYFNYSATWTEKEKPAHRSFAIIKYGEQLAFEMACAWRKVKEIVESNPLESYSLECDFNEKYSKYLVDEFPIGVKLKANHGKENQLFSVALSKGAVKFSKSFSIKKYGYDEALRLACEWRKQMEELYRS